MTYSQEILNRVKKELEISYEGIKKSLLGEKEANYGIEMLNRLKEKMDTSYRDMKNKILGDKETERFKVLAGIQSKDKRNWLKQHKNEEIKEISFIIKNDEDKRKYIELEKELKKSQEELPYQPKPISIGTQETKINIEVIGIYPHNYTIDIK